MNSFQEPPDIGERQHQTYARGFEVLLHETLVNPVLGETLKICSTPRTESVDKLLHEPGKDLEDIHVHPQRRQPPPPPLLLLKSSAQHNNNIRRSLLYVTRADSWLHQTSVLSQLPSCLVQVDCSQPDDANTSSSHQHEPRRDDHSPSIFSSTHGTEIRNPKNLDSQGVLEFSCSVGLFCHLHQAPLSS